MMSVQEFAAPARSARTSTAPLYGRLWKNWTGRQSCRPEVLYLPQSEEALAEIVRQARGTVRVAGAGHSFSPLVPTDQTLIQLDRLSGLVGVDRAQSQATCWAGTRIHDLGEPLRDHRLALINQGDVDFQAIAGAMATGTHGTGLAFGCLASDVTAFRLVTADGEVLSCDRQQHPEIFSAGRVALGALGIMSQVTLQCRQAFYLKEELSTRSLEECLASADELAAAHQHFEFFCFPYADKVVVKTLDDAPGVCTPCCEPDPREETLLRFACDLVRSCSALIPPVQRLAMATYWPRVRSGPSHLIFPSPRGVRFNEMEYEVPAEYGAACFADLVQLVRRRRLPVSFPLEYRRVKGDDIWLSPFYGRDSVAISVHQYYRRPYRELFRILEPVFWKYGGRPHWGKLHTLSAAELRPLYPRWDEFQALRERLDPQGKFLNAHLRRLMLSPR